MLTFLPQPKHISKTRCKSIIRRHNATQCTSRDATINAFVSFATPPAEAAPKPGSLSGLSIAVKDNICTKSFPTTCSSVMLKGFNARYNASVVQLLEDAGAHICGKTNCDEFGMGSLNLQSCFGPVVNPFQSELEDVPWEKREQRCAGGSSGGSAAAVASGQCFAALATDTGGSTRLPASYCGIVGFKPSYGLLSRWGVISFADSLDTVGIMASKVDDVRRVFNVVSKFDQRDPTSIPLELRHRATELCEELISKYIPANVAGLQGLRVGIPQEAFPKELDPSLLVPLRKILEQLQERGASLIPVSMPSITYALSAYYVLASAEASSNMARYDGIRYGSFTPPPPSSDKTNTAEVYSHSRTAGFGQEVKKRILLGTYALTADAFDNYFLQAQKLRNLVREDFNNVFRMPNVLGGPTDSRQAHADHPEVDVLLHLSAIRTAPRISEAKSQGIETYVQDVLTVPASLAGVPAISIPVGKGADGWPVGVSLLGQWGCEGMVLRISEAIESMVVK